MTTDKINFFQINLHNSYRAQEELESRMSECGNPSIAFIQEPPLPNHKIKYPHNYDNFASPVDSRACLFIPKVLKFTYLPSLSNETLMVCLLYTSPSPRD